MSIGGTPSNASASPKRLRGSVRGLPPSVPGAWRPAFLPHRLTAFPGSGRDFTAQRALCILIISGVAAYAPSILVAVSGGSISPGEHVWGEVHVWLRDLGFAPHEHHIRVSTIPRHRAWRAVALRTVAILAQGIEARASDEKRNLLSDATSRSTSRRCAVLNVVPVISTLLCSEDCIEPRSFVNSSCARH